VAPSSRRSTGHPAWLGRGLCRRGRGRAGQWRWRPLGLPGGRPEPGEDWGDILRREVREESCATVTGCRLLGFSRGVCARGPQAGLVLVRALWWAEVRPRRWRPRFEIVGRRLVPIAEAFDSIWIEAGFLGRCTAGSSSRRRFPSDREAARPSACGRTYRASIVSSRWAATTGARGCAGCLPAILLPVGYSLPRGLAAPGGAPRARRALRSSPFFQLTERGRVGPRPAQAAAVGRRSPCAATTACPGRGRG
jgi:hypothetical protein